MRVLVTGGCGFLGSHVCERFRGEGWEVVALDNLSKHELTRTGYDVQAAREHNLRWLDGIGATLARVDVTDLEAVCDHAAGADFIVHTAAQPAMTIGMEEPLVDLRTNVLGTAHVLEAARRHRVPVVTCSTIHVYGTWVNDTLEERATRYTREPGTIDEAARMLGGPLTPLHASKAAGEHYVRVYADSYGVRAAAFRFTGLYGPRQFGGEDHGWVANFCIRNVIGLPLTVYGTGKQVRDILYASDAAEAFIDFFRRGEPGIYNVGGGLGTAISLLECIEVIDAITGRRSEVRFGPPRFGDLQYFVCDITRATETFGWRPRVTVREGLAALIGWIESARKIFTPREPARS